MSGAAKVSAVARPMPVLVPVMSMDAMMWSPLLFCGSSSFHDELPPRAQGAGLDFGLTLAGDQIEFSVMSDPTIASPRSLPSLLVGSLSLFSL